jgi:polyketide synthase PksL
MIDSACCSSLYAVDQAVTDIRAGKCSAALVGGVNYIGTPHGFNAYAVMDFLAKDWRCKAFAEGADGWTKGELFAAVYLKPLAQALEDKDAIYAVIKASGTNHGGRSNFYEQPNSTKHLELITKVYRDGGLDPRDLVHIEAHGTGTEMGDAIEYNVLLRAVNGLAKERGVALDPHSCGLGSIKSNMGHAEAAAGIAGFIKTVLLLHEKVIPPSLHIKVPNKHIRSNNSALYLATEAQALAQRSRDGQRYHAGVHSFNFSGAAAHVLVAEAPDLPLGEGSLGLTQYPFCLSAPSLEGLQAYLQAFIQHLDSNPVASLDGLAYTLNRSKSHFPHRLAITTRSIAELRQQFIDASLAIVEGRVSGGESRIGEGMTYRHLEPKAGRKVRDYVRLSDANVSVLLEHWLSEGGFDWSVVLAPYRLVKQHLPVYSFANERIYFPRMAEGAPLRTVTIAAAAESSVHQSKPGRLGDAVQKLDLAVSDEQGSSSRVLRSDELMRNAGNIG